MESHSDVRSPQLHLSCKANAFSIASLMASEDEGNFGPFDKHILPVQYNIFRHVVVKIQLQSAEIFYDSCHHFPVWKTMPIIR